MQNKLSWIALGLWIVTIASVGILFLRGTTSQSVDSRTQVNVNGSERVLILGEMRGLLKSVHGILQGIEDNDKKAIAQSAREGGMAAAADIEPSLMMKLPLDFKSRGMHVHREFDRIASLADKNAPNAEIQKALTAQLANCLGCHATYRLGP